MAQGKHIANSKLLNEFNLPKSKKHPGNLPSSLSIFQFIRSTTTMLRVCSGTGKLWGWLVYGYGEALSRSPLALGDLSRRGDLEWERDLKLIIITFNAVQINYIGMLTLQNSLTISFQNSFKATGLEHEEIKVPLSQSMWKPRVSTCLDFRCNVLGILHFDLLP